MEQLLGSVEQLIHSNPWLAFAAVFIGGAMTASNPCVVAMVPLAVAFVGGGDVTSNWRRSFTFSLCMVAGLSVTFTVLGILAALSGSLFGAHSQVWKYLVVAVCLVMGIHLLDIIKVPLPQIVSNPSPRKGALGAFILGILFGTVSTPCAAPVLAILLAYLSGTDRSLAYGGALLFTYGTGHSLLILAAGTSMGVAKGILESKKITKANQILRRSAGIIIILVGFYFLRGVF